MAAHPHSLEGDSCCAGSGSLISPLRQTLGELDFERGIWNAAVTGDVAEMEKKLSCGAECNAKDSSGFTALHYASRNGHTQICKLLLSKGAKTEVQTLAGEVTPLHRAAYCGHTEIVELLLSYGADAMIPDADGKTALHKAAEKGHEDIIKTLISKFPDLVDQIDKKRHCAADYIPLSSKDLAALFHS